MEPAALYQWILKYGYYIGQVCLLITAAMMVRSRKGATEWIALAGFGAFLVGSLMMLDTKGALIHLGPINIGSRSDRQLWQVGQALATFGFLTGALSLMLNKLLQR
jgi:cell division protein FtsW (lipid II flippase)